MAKKERARPKSERLVPSASAESDAGAAEPEVALSTGDAELEPEAEARATPSGGGRDDEHSEEDQDTDRGGAGDALSDEELVRSVTALLFASHEPLSLGKLAGLLERPRAVRLRAALEALGGALRAGALPIELREISGGWQLFTTPDQDEVVALLARVKKDERVSPAALETLSVIAYRQPVSKAEIEAIRGVQAGPILRTLVDRGLVRVTGRADVPGHPLLYGTTKKFLDSFGLASLAELPRDGELVRD